MKKNSFFTKKPKLGFIALMAVFFCFFANTAMAQDTFNWNGSVSNDWATAANWTKTGTAGTDTYPGQTNGRNLDVVTISNGGTPIVSSNANPYGMTRIVISNATGAVTGSVLTINSGATLNVGSSGSNNVQLNGGNIVNNGALNIATTAAGFASFPAYGINCGNPTVLPSTPTEYGITGNGTMTINIGSANFAGAAAIAAVGNSGATTTPTNNANVTYRIVANNPSITLNQASANTIAAVRSLGGNNANKLIISGSGFTIGSVGSPDSKSQLIGLSAGCNITVDTGTTLTFNSAATNANNGIISGFGGSALPFNLTNKGTINIVGSTSRSGLFFTTGAGTSAIVVTFNIVNEGTFNVDLNSSGVGHGAFATGNGGGTSAAGTAVNINNSGTLTFKNTSTVVGTGSAYFGSQAGEAPPVILTNSGTTNFEGSVYNLGSKTTINNSGIFNSNNELKGFTAINNNLGGTINFVRTAATETTRQIVFTGLATTAQASAGAIYSDGTNNYTIVTQKFNFGTNVVTNALSSSIVGTVAGTLTKVSGTGDATISFGGVNVSALKNALPSTTNNSGTVNTDTASNLNIISGVSAASAGTIAPGGSGKGIADFSNGSTLAINSILKLDVSGNATAGVNYDQITNSATGGGFDLTGATLDVTGIYLPGTYTVIDIITTNASGNLTGTFASVVGLGAGWSVVYNPGTAGTVQLVRGTAGTPTITRLSSNGTNTITSACEGSTLVIIGTNLTGVSEITVDGVALTGVTDISSTRAEGILPIGARVGQVAVTGPGGTVTTAGNLTVVENSTVVTAITACDTYTWANNGQTYTTSGTYTGTTTSCVTQQLVLNIVTTPAPIVTSVSQCGGTYVWPSNGVTYSTSGTYNIIVGCTAETLNLTITAPSTTGSETRNECGASYTWPTSGATYNASGVYTHVVGCNTATLTLTLGSPSTTGSETVSACGNSYTWALNGQTYNASGNYTHVVGCNTATLALTLTPSTTTGSETISQCGGTYTWPVNGSTYSASTTQVVTSGCNTATLNLTITPATTTGSETITQCGGTYTWPVNSVTYSASETVVVTSGCNTATLNLTITAPTTTGSITQVQTGGSYLWAANGQTYSTSGTYTHVVGCNTATLTLTINPATTEIPPNFPAFCKGATIATATGTTSLKFYSAQTGGAALASTTALANAKTLWVTEVINSVETTPRIGKLITVNNLPATPSAVVSNPLTESKNICKYIGSSTPLTFDATASGAVSYIWTVPAGASIVTGGTGSSIGVSFAGASTTVGAIGSVSVKSVDANGCASVAKSLAIITKLPTAPASLVMTSLDNTPHFDAVTTPAVPLVSPAIISTVGLNFLSKVTKVGPYMKTSTVFTLTAPLAPTAASYAWTLPLGTTQLSGGTTNVITVEFSGVELGTIGALPVSVQSVGGCGSSALRTLTLARAVPGAPKALVLTNSTQPNLSALPKITKVGPYAGTAIPFTLTATPVRVQGATATSYAWILPAGMVCETTNTETTVLQKVAVPITVENPSGFVINSFAAISTSTNVITVNFSTATGTGNLDVLVFGVNGAGNSIARKLVLARALPTAPTALTLRDGTTIIKAVGPYTAKTTALTLTATPVTTQGAEATSFSWILPAGVNVTGGATNVTTPATDVNGNKTWTSTGTVLTVNLAGIGTGIVSIPLSVQAVNGAGTSLTTRTLTVTAAVPATPSIVGSSTTFNTCSTRTYTATSLSTGITSYTWTIPAGATIVGASNGNVIVVEFSATTFALGASSAVTCYATNGTGNSTVKSLTVKKAADSCKDANTTGASAFNVIAYPNPSSSEFTIETSAKGATSFQVYDIQGRLIENRKANSNSVQLGSRYAAGAYNVIVKQDNNTRTVRVIKK